MMEMNASPLPVSFDESQWGRLQSWEKIAPGAYEICAEHEEGYLIDKEESKGIISERTYQYGIESNDKKCIYFDYEHGKHVIEYEITLYRLRHCEDCDKHDLQEELMSTVLYGAEEYGSYFGAWIPQPTTPWGPRHRYITVGNGIWFVQTNGKWVLSLCHVLAEGLNRFPSNLAMGNRGTYPDLTSENMFWTLEDCAPVIYDLLNENICPNIVDYITSIEDLHCCLCECFPAYTKFHNSNIEEAIELRKTDDRNDISILESQLIKRVEGSSIQFLKPIN